MPRTRIKICGLTREEDVIAAVEAGADAIGLVFYPESPRYVTPAQAARLAREVPPFVSTVGLFVNADSATVTSVLSEVPLSVLQFHGDETPEMCRNMAEKAHLPYLRAARVRPELNLVEFAKDYQSATALLLDAFVEGYGGGGHIFDWTLIPQPWLDPVSTSAPRDHSAVPRLVLSGGLNAQNVAGAIERVRPCAVDVSSGVESAKGIKDHARIAAFIKAVRMADAERV
jgi:phosphoribosylanthranilate isomerase